MERAVGSFSALRAHERLTGFRIYNHEITNIFGSLELPEGFPGHRVGDYVMIVLGLEDRNERKWLSHAS